MKKVLIAEVISESRNGQSAEVTTMFGGTSVTRHVKKNSPAWVGHNPDPNAKPMNEYANGLLAQAQGAFEIATGHLQKAHEIVENGVSPEFLKRAEIAALMLGDARTLTVATLTPELVRRLVEEALPTLEMRRDDAAERLGQAQAYLKSVEEEFPLMVEFVKFS